MKIIRFIYLALILLPLLLLSFSAEGSAQKNWDFKPSVSVSETYDSNIYSRRDAVDDYVTKVSANLSAIYSGADVGLKVGYLAALNTFSIHPELNVVTQDGNIDVDLDRWFRKFFKETDVTVTDDFTFTPDLQDYFFDEESGQAGSLGNYGVRTVRTDSYRNALSIELRVPLSQRQDIRTRYSNLLTEYSDPNLIDNMTHTASIGTNYKFAKEMLSGDTGIRYIRADSADSRIYFVTAGVRHTFSPVSIFDINAGADILDYERGDDTSTMRGDLRFSTRSRRFTYNVGYSRALNPGSGVSPRPAVSQLFYINASGLLTKTLSSGLNANYAMNKASNGNGVDTQSYNLSARLSYPIRPWLQGMVSVSHFNQESQTPAAQDISRNLVMLQITATM
ncbi:MAG: hypothetical protein HZA12_03235 [Nitrospirae bacterium]|nr:hypothetical protein [Nitrospirota bacterium]